MRIQMRNVLMGVGALAVLAMPAATTFAGADQPQEFTAQGAACVDVSGGVPTSLTYLSVVPDGNKLLVTAKGENAYGTVSQFRGWNGIENASVSATVGQEDSTFNLSGRRVYGSLSGGSLTVNTDHNGLYTGTFDGTITGAFLDPSDPIATLYQSTPRIRFTVSNGTSVLSGNADITFSGNPGDPSHFCGTMTLQGVRKSA